MSLLVSNFENLAAVPDREESSQQISFAIRPMAGESIPALCRRLAWQLHGYAATPLHLLVFGNIHASSAALAALQNSIGSRDWPVTWVEGAACAGQPIAGIQVHAFSGNVERIAFGGRIVGSAFSEAGARQCFVGGLTPANKTDSRPEQTRRALEDLQVILAQAGFEFSDTVRTWFYLENILSWYDAFNRARTKIYSGVKFRTGSTPASTGVGAKNPGGSALALAALAFRPVNANSRAEEVISPLQCPAPAYGSAFSRAVELTTDRGRRLHISGTASIEPGGQTLWVGNVPKQIELTMEVVAAILNARGFTWGDLSRATAYFRKPTDAVVFAEWLAANQLTNLPVVSAQCDVCRDDLLFELEAEAESGRPRVEQVRCNQTVEPAPARSSSRRAAAGPGARG